MRKKKILFIVNYFYPDVASVSSLMTDLCMELQDEFQVTVIAAQPNYAGEEIGRVKLIEIEFIEKIKVIRLNLPKVDKTNKFSRLKYISTYFFLAIYALLKCKKPNVIYSISQPPIIGGLIGTIGKIFKRSKHIYNIQDFNPEQAAAISYVGKKWMFGIAKVIDNINCKLADHIVVVGQDMQLTLNNRMKWKSPPMSSVINNWTDEQEIVPLEKDHPIVNEFLTQHNLNGKFVVMYSGNIGLFYDLENIIKITERFKEYPDICFVFIGDGAVKKQLESYVKFSKIGNCHFLPYQDKSFIKYSLNAADLHLVVNQKGIKGVSVPSKIYGVMAAGKTILGVLEKESEAERLISTSNCGVVVEPHEYDKMVEIIKKLYNMDRLALRNMGERGRAYLEKNLCKEHSINKYKLLLRNL